MKKVIEYILMPLLVIGGLVAFILHDSKEQKKGLDAHPERNGQRHPSNQLWVGS